MPMAFLATWAHSWLMFSCCQPVPSGPFPPGSFPATLPQPVAVFGVDMTQGQDSALGLAEPQTIALGPSIQPVRTSLKRLPTLQQINTSAQLGVICKMITGALDHVIHTINEDIKQGWSQY
ncbi:hypothetical protein HGM15179_001331 [Zosterops borbonicus]|uniref:Uncharacterized protein n=1 Tax=Zosterops borbonicus TaxID=364589 RepID=A0A8K1LT00_9PASS|nr:hypothetical protein HGM15179_001331 [Zosterops borbonicus]